MPIGQKISFFMTDCKDITDVSEMTEHKFAKERSLSRSKSNLDIQSEIQRSYERLQRNLSQEFQR